VKFQFANQRSGEYQRNTGKMHNTKLNGSEIYTFQNLDITVRCS